MDVATVFIGEGSWRLREQAQADALKNKLDLKISVYDPRRVSYLGSNGKNVELTGDWICLTPNPFALHFAFDKHIITPDEEGVFMQYTRKDRTVETRLDTFPSHHRYSPPDVDMHYRQTHGFFFAESSVKLWVPEHFHNGPFACKCEKSEVKEKPVSTLLASGENLQYLNVGEGGYVITWYGMQPESYCSNVLSPTQFSFVPYEKEDIKGKFVEKSYFVFSPDLIGGRKMNPFPFGGVSRRKVRIKTLEESEQIQEFRLCVGFLDLPVGVEKLIEYGIVPNTKWDIDLSTLPVRCVIAETIQDLFTYSPSILNLFFGKAGTQMVGKREHVTNDFSQGDRIMGSVSRIGSSIEYEIDPQIIELKRMIAEEYSKEEINFKLVQVLRKFGKESKYEIAHLSGEDPLKIDHDAILRELMIEEYPIRGRTTVEIAEEVGVSERVVQSHLQGRADVTFWNDRWILSNFFVEMVKWSEEEKMIPLQRVRDKLLLERKLELRGSWGQNNLWYLRNFLFAQGLFSYRVQVGHEFVVFSR